MGLRGFPDNPMTAKNFPIFPVLATLLYLGAIDFASGQNSQLAEAASEQAVEKPLPINFFERGEATVIANERKGGETFSGRSYDPLQLTAAHESLPMGVKVRVMNQATGRSVDVEVIDRLKDARETISLSRAAASRLKLNAEATSVTLTSTLVRRPAIAARKIQPLRPAEGATLVRMTPLSEFLARVEAPPRDLIPVSAAAADLVEDSPQETPAEPKAEPQETPPPAEPAAAGDFRLQFGAFAKEQNAAGLSAELNSKGIDTEVIKRPGQVLYKVVSQRTFESTVVATKWGEQLVQDQGVEQTVVTR